MAIEVSPEIQAMIDQDVARGPYGSAREFVEEAIRRLHAEQESLAEARAEVVKMINEALDEPEDEYLDLEEVERSMEQMKREWRAARHRS